MSPTWQGSGVATQILVLTGRSIRSLVGDPSRVTLALLMPLIMLGLFSQVFAGLAGSAGFPPGVSYIDYLVPAILVNTAMQSALQTGVGLTEDMRSGVLARLRSLPIWMGSVLFARSLADLVRGAVQLVIMVVVAVLVFGFSPGGGPSGVAGAVLLSLVVGWGLGWAFLALATWMRNAETMQQIGMVAMFPLMFASSAFVTIESLPGWLQVIARVNPLSYAVDASRDLCLEGSAGNGVLIAVGISLVLALTGGTIAAKRIRRL